jgi:Glycosyl transferases group 1
MRRLTILTWHVHGSYLEALGRTGHDIVVPVLPGRPPRFGGRPEDARWPESIREVPVAAVRRLRTDLVLFQHAANWTLDQSILSEEQRRGPRIFLEHDPPDGHPTDTRHPVDDPNVLLVHVTPYNALMWDPGRTPTRVIDHGVAVPDGVEATLELQRGVVVVNNLARRGRRLGADLVEDARRSIPLDLYGMGSEQLGGLGEVPRDVLVRRTAEYRFFFHPARHTSLGLAVIEAMLIGLPVVGLATTELPTVIENGVSGIIDTRPERLLDGMRMLLADRGLARDLGRLGRAAAWERFRIERFVQDWDATFREVADVGAATRFVPGRPVAAGGNGTGAGVVLP